MFSIRKKNEKKKQQKQLNFSYFIWTWLSITLQLLWQQQLSFFWIYFQTENNERKKIRKWEKQVGIEGIIIIYAGEENAKRWQLYYSVLLKFTGHK